MEDETKLNIEAGRTNQEIVMSFRKQLKQAEYQLNLMLEDKKLREDILEFEKSHCKLVDGKLEFLTSEDYFTLIMNQKDLKLRIDMVQMKDNISQTEGMIKGINKEIIRLSRNGVQEEIKSEEVKIKEASVVKSAPEGADLK